MLVFHESPILDWRSEEHHERQLLGFCPRSRDQTNPLPSGPPEPQGQKMGTQTKCNLNMDRAPPIAILILASPLQTGGSTIPARATSLHCTIFAVRATVVARKTEQRRCRASPCSAAPSQQQRQCCQPALTIRASFAAARTASIERRRQHAASAGDAADSIAAAGRPGVHVCFHRRRRVETSSQTLARSRSHAVHNPGLHCDRKPRDRRHLAWEAGAHAHGPRSP